MAKPAKAQLRPIDTRLRVGVIAGDPLRGLGFQAIFKDHFFIAVVPVEDADPLDQLDVDLVLVAAQNASQVFDAIRDIRAARPGMRLLVMATREEPEFVERVLRVGANGYLTATAALAEIEEAIALVYEGRTWRPLRTSEAEVLPAVAAGSDAVLAGVNRFTGRELEVLELLHSGQSNREIAESLQIEERTVKSHVAHLLKKTGVKNRTALVMQVIGQNLVGSVRI